MIRPIEDNRTEHVLVAVDPGRVDEAIAALRAARPDWTVRVAAPPSNLEPGETAIYCQTISAPGDRDLVDGSLQILRDAGLTTRNLSSSVQIGAGGGWLDVLLDGQPAGVPIPATGDRFIALEATASMLKVDVTRLSVDPDQDPYTNLDWAK